MINKLESELKETKDKLKQTSMKKEALEKAIWDMINYANIFVLLLDSKMHVLLINQSFSKTLGFDDAKEVIDKCWLDFIKPEDKDLITAVHHSLAFDGEKESKKYREVVSDIIKLDGESLSIKWFNFPINHQYNLTFSFGIPTEVPAEITEESIRTYYREILLKDKTMILSLKDMAIKDLQTLDNCERELTELDGPF
jgi:PAS domain S-box-containing protein